ncbi:MULTISPECIES: C45 family autoproteolytic acyltransferase/hydolase [unclassified Streptomyces]|uniref:C45 family autoproteolytic acyltransferase/hydolase n=1 Tax=unclassified Streptomyces TaxID=2593676 RepID=UPI002250246D|nr:MULTISPECIES: C45 family peptidase [unclassified Streptomyces]MCX4796798.1 C45 family peptidase [Streptomyces sp. NBC_01242]WSP55718.1 C45 family peptidase [Streptomyces sp. NBC_01241]WSP64417.1 C45 family peptidase [Streptomyces sp. NBC_01240]WSU23546.1 C45 family peptidase [Streptomyces sp. NBC_01108]
MSAVPVRSAHTRFTSAVAEPRDRGREFGEIWRERVRATADAYGELFGRAGVPDTDASGVTALARVHTWAPGLADEIRGIAEGAGLPVNRVAALNARTEILASGRPGPGECTTVVALGGPGTEPVAAQNWDWYESLADSWLEWEIPHPDGRVTRTLTEFGVVGKIGINDRGVGCLFNILHHRRDGSGMGVPVHVVARRLLDEAATVTHALKIAGSAGSTGTTGSTTLTVVGALAAGRTAVSAELWPGGIGHVLPDPDGLLLHTNHFLTRPAADGDTEPVTDPDTIVRYEVLRRRLHGRGADLTPDEALAALSDHTGGVCVHPAAEGPHEFRTLATVFLDTAARALRVIPGPPCTRPKPGEAVG